jgi:hypothetical protein
MVALRLGQKWFPYRQLATRAEHWSWILVLSFNSFQTPSCLGKSKLKVALRLGQKWFPYRQLAARAEHWSWIWLLLVVFFLNANYYSSRK